MPGRRSGRPRTRWRCTGCPGCGEREVVSERALWWIGKALACNSFLAHCCDSLGFLWAYQTTIQVFLPDTVVMWFLALFCSFINIVTMLEESIPYFKLCEYAVPFFAALWFVLSSALYGAPTCIYFIYALAWLSYETIAFIFSFLSSTLVESSPAAETWGEICFQVFVLVFLLPCSTDVLVDFDEVDSSDVALIKDFGGCNCECEGKDITELLEVTKWSFGAEKRRELLEVAKCFELLRSGLRFSDLPPQYMIKVANFVEEKAKKQSQVQKSVSLKYQCCMSCGEVSHDNLDNAQLLSQNEVLLEQTSTEVTVKIFQITDQMACGTFSQKDHSKTHEAECEDAEDIKSAEPNDYETTTFITPELVLSDENGLKQKQTDIVPNNQSSLAEPVTMITGYELPPIGAETTVIETEPPVVEARSTETKYETTVVQTKFENEEKPNDNNAKQCLVEPKTDNDHSSFTESQKKMASDLVDNILTKLIEVGEPTKKTCGQDGCQEKESLQLCSRCRNISYCSFECSAADWPRHKAACTMEKERRERRRQRKREAAMEAASEVD